MKKTIKKANPHRSIYTALAVAGLYLILGSLWIFVSEQQLFGQWRPANILAQASLMKGLGFILFTALLTGLLVAVALRKMESINHKLTDAATSLQHRNEELEAAREREHKKNMALVQHQQAMQNLLYRDEWTGLKNRRALRETLESHIARRPDSPLQVFYMDLDNFKLVNDVYGHTFGDLFIQVAATRLRSLLPSNWLLYRMGGDEFIYLRRAAIESSELKITAQLLLKGFSQPFTIEGTTVHASISIGIAQYPIHAETTDDLLKRVDIAMYRAKLSGRSTYVMFDDKMAAPVIDRFLMVEALQQAISHHEFHLNYQPQLDVSSGTISGFEALLRWDSALLGSVPPGLFIPVAESSRHILPIGEWVLRHACMFLKRVHQAGYPHIRMAVNVSMLQLMQDDFVQMADAILSVFGISPESVDLEVTESMLMESRERVLPVLYKLRNLGFGISLDDFGQGYSSLSYLRDMPITVLKIDKSFVDAIEEVGHGKMLVGSVIALGHNLSFRVVAEGVESRLQKEFLELKGCDSIQGYWFSRPVPEEEALCLLQAGPLQTLSTDCEVVAPPFVWKDEYSVGHPLMDAHHQTLFGIARRLFDNLRVFEEGQPQAHEERLTTPQQQTDTSALLHELLDYVTFHFAAEEKLLEERSYHALSVHRVEHEFLVKALEGLDVNATLSDGSKELRHVISIVTRWVTRHILMEDQHYAPILKSDNSPVKPVE